MDTRFSLLLHIQYVLPYHPSNYANAISLFVILASLERETISKLLRNEKNTGDVLLQKAFMKDVLTGKQFKNCGELEQHLSNIPR